MDSQHTIESKICYGVQVVGGGEKRSGRRSLPALVASSLLLLALIAPFSEAEAQLFIVQGEQGVPGGRGPEGASQLECADSACTVTADLVVEGDISGEGDLGVVGESAVGSLEVSELTVTMSVWLPECPAGYERETDVDEFVLCTNGPDEMVKVGDFWVDRYESSVWENADCSGAQFGDTNDWDETSGFPLHGSFTNPYYACSVAGVTPSAHITWFRAQAACAASGKRLLTNGEWQAASAGTEDGAGCAVFEDGVRLTGAGTCVSHWGAEDMIGNLAEVVEDWYGQGADERDGTQASDFFSDLYHNVDPAPVGHGSSHFPAAVSRGQNWSAGTRSGTFAMGFAGQPSMARAFMGFRCARNQ